MSFTVNALKPVDYEQWSELFRKYCLKRKFKLENHMLVDIWNQCASSDHPLKGIVVRNKAGVLVAFSHFQPVPLPFVGHASGYIADHYIDSVSCRKQIAEIMHYEIMKVLETQKGPTIDTQVSLIPGIAGQALNCFPS